MYILWWLVDRFIKQNCCFPKHIDYPTANGHLYTQSPIWQACQWRKSVESLQDNINFFHEALKYSHYNFENKLWNENELMQYLRTWCFSKNVAFDAIKAFQQGQEYLEPDLWQKYEEFGIDILDFSDTPMHLLYLGIKKYIVSMIPTLLKQILRKEQHFGRLASKSWNLCRENALAHGYANKSDNKDGSVHTK